MMRLFSIITLWANRLLTVPLCIYIIPDAALYVNKIIAVLCRCSGLGRLFCLADRRAGQGTANARRTSRAEQRSYKPPYGFITQYGGNSRTTTAANIAVLGGKTDGCIAHQSNGSVAEPAEPNSGKPKKGKRKTAGSQTRCFVLLW